MLDFVLLLLLIQLHGHFEGSCLKSCLIVFCCTNRLLFLFGASKFKSMRVGYRWLCDSIIFSFICKAPNHNKYICIMQGDETGPSALCWPDTMPGLITSFHVGYFTKSYPLSEPAALLFSKRQQENERKPGGPGDGSLLGE